MQSSAFGAGLKCPAVGFMVLRLVCFRRRLFLSASARCLLDIQPTRPSQLDWLLRAYGHCFLLQLLHLSPMRVRLAFVLRVLLTVCQQWSSLTRDLIRTCWALANMRAGARTRSLVCVLGKETMSAVASIADVRKVVLTVGAESWFDGLFRVH